MPGKFVEYLTSWVTTENEDQCNVTYGLLKKPEHADCLKELIQVILEVWRRLWPILPPFKILSVRIKAFGVRINCCLSVNWCSTPWLHVQHTIRMKFIGVRLYKWRLFQVCVFIEVSKSNIIVEANGKKDKYDNEWPEIKLRGKLSASSKVSNTIRTVNVIEYDKIKYIHLGIVMVAKAIKALTHDKNQTVSWAGN